MMASYRIVIADDHTLMRDGIKSLIIQSPDLSVVGEAGDGFQLLRLLKHTQPDMVIMDIGMPGLRGLEACREVKCQYPQVAVLFLTMHKNKEYLSKALAYGASGYLLKENTGDELLVAIDTIQKGKSYLSPLLASEFSIDLIDICQGKPSDSADPLTRREGEILKLIAEGQTNRQIGELLCISHRTVQQHRLNIRKKLNLRKTADLVKYAIQKGYISDNHF